MILQTSVHSFWNKKIKYGLSFTSTAVYFNIMQRQFIVYLICNTSICSNEEWFYKTILQVNVLNIGICLWTNVGLFGYKCNGFCAEEFSLYDTYW